MATTKITATLPAGPSGAAPTVSAFVQRAVEMALQDASGWRATLDDAMQQTGGPLTDKERAWVDSLLLPRYAKKAANTRKAPRDATRTLY
jgi:hypothetical protein